MAHLFPNIWRLMNRHPVWTSFLLVSPIILYLNLNPANFEFHYDSLGYWTRSNYFIRDGFFSFQNYDFPLRGYLLSFIILGIKNMAYQMDILDYIFYEIVMSLFYSIMITVVLPDFVNNLFHRKTGVLQILVFSFFMIYFWNGYFFYPLTDLPAFFFVLLGVYILLKFHRHWRTGVFIGLVWGGSTLLRPSYQVSLIPLFLWGWYFYHKETSLNIQQILVRVLTILAGMIIVFSPQIVINHYNYGIFSPFTQTQIFLKGTNLFSTQLGWGFDLQKYETNIGINYPSPRVRFLDPYGENILIRAGYKSAPYAKSGQIGPDSPLKLTEYLELVGRYPLDFLVLYSRHFFNGLDIRYDTVYVTNIYDNAFLRRFMNYTIWFLVTIYIKSKISFQRDTRLILPIIFALPALLSTPAVMEVRFMFPLYIMAYALVAFEILPKFFSLVLIQKKKVVLRYLPWYFVFLILCFIFSANTYIELEYGMYAMSVK